MQPVYMLVGMQAIGVVVKKEEPTTPAVPRRSPIQVLSRPDTA